MFILVKKMPGMKKGKELKVNTLKNYNIKYGCVDNWDAKAVYINLSCWAELKEDFELDYFRIIRDIDKQIRQSLYKNINNLIFLNERTIVDFDIRESGIKFGKRSFANCEITLYTKNNIPVNSELLRPLLDDITNNILKDIFEKSKYFNFYKRKK
jgi:hypothetical protein